MKMLRTSFSAFFIFGLLLFSVSSCDLLNYDDIQEEQRMGGGGENPPCNKDCK